MMAELATWVVSDDTVSVFRVDPEVTGLVDSTHGDRPIEIVPDRLTVTVDRLGSEVTVKVEGLVMLKDGKVGSARRSRTWNWTRIGYSILDDAPSGMPFWVRRAVAGVSGA